jgi:hypothetical protein
VTVAINTRVSDVLRTLAAAAVITLAVGGCSAKPSQEQGMKVVRPGDLVAIEGPAPEGRFYVKAGDNSLDADLYEFAFFPPRQDRITRKARVSTVDGCADKVVVSAAQKEVGLTDHLQELQGGRLAPVEKLGTQPGSDPHVSSDCRILYVRLAEAASELISEVILFDPVTGTSTSVMKGSTLASAAWGPGGEILILKREPTGPELVVVKPDGSQRMIKAEQPDVGNPLWGRSGWIATDIAELRQPPTGTLFINPATMERSQLDGWLPLAWSPDGRQLLVAEAGRGTTLAVVELPDLTRTRNVGVSEVGTVWDAVWLPPG